MVPITLTNLTMRYNQRGVMVLQDIDLAIAAGELFFLLGPSGCGKSTLLRLVAGLLSPTSGRIRFGDRDVTDLPTERRQTAMVFQNYALWPHLTVLENVRFGLDAAGIPRPTADAQTRATLAMVEMAAVAERRPGTLSGGQQQRVALARALAVKPQVLLLDEPLSNLDTQLRLNMRRELRRLCKDTGLTAIYVTHDQQEALSMADRIAVLADGRLQQVGTPRDLYRQPATRAVAEFIGGGNFIDGKVLGHESDRLLVTTALGTLACAVPASGVRPAIGAPVTLLIRPECLRPEPAGMAATANNVLSATVVETTFLGEFGQCLVQAGDLRLLLSELHPPPRTPGEALRLHIAPEDVVFLSRNNSWAPAAAIIASNQCRDAS